MRAAEVGDRVRVHFTGRLRDGTVVASSHEADPVEFTVGNGEVMPGLDDLVQGMRLGERRSAELPPHRAHGRHRNDLLLAVERERFPRHVDPYTGQDLIMRRQGGPPAQVRVVATTADMVLLDTNHPLAGKDLRIDVELLDIVEQNSEVVC
ncbi:MAG TPA: FKBP-type peptidyl-prolyl cis-trans isomerase [Longimicrobiaceae bacterium]|nr:FKBP-type peptidyl-prolyl cis-trans isomerase [Longimicrobiaceae bacterium]